MLGLLAPDAVARLTSSGRARARGDVSAQRVGLQARYECDLAAFLNALHRRDLEALASELKLELKGKVADLRSRLWRWGAIGEAGTDGYLGSALQPMPSILRGKLVHFRAQPGLAPAADHLPRPIPPDARVPAFCAEPDTLEQLLDRANELVGVRLGQRGRDKGAHGTRIAELLRVVEEGFSEPDWRGEVEIKTIPVVRDQGGLWWVREDPAVSMATTRPMAKLQRVLWIARVADEHQSPILSWFYQEHNQDLQRLFIRDLHTRPKGPAGATTRGWYLHKRFFADSGLRRSLNGG